MTWAWLGRCVSGALPAGPYGSTLWPSLVSQRPSVPATNLNIPLHHPSLFHPLPPSISSQFPFNQNNLQPPFSYSNDKPCPILGYETYLRLRLIGLLATPRLFCFPPAIRRSSDSTAQLRSLSTVLYQLQRSFSKSL
ncbi:hypothetical protein BDW75DRAFT_188705 [Aspergillus navahoensis]